MSASMEPSPGSHDRRSFEKQGYAMIARSSEVLKSPLRKLREEIVSFAKVDGSSRVLNVGAGTGGQAFAFAPKVREVVAIDTSDAVLRIARRQNRFANIIFQRANAETLPFEDESFDVSCVSFGLRSLAPSVRERILREMARVTKPGGSVIIVDYALPQRRVSQWLKPELGASIAEMGIDVSQRRTALKGFATIVAGRRGEVHTRSDTDESGRKRFGDGERDIVDEASWESFPASDPPAY